jgi:hypothetical protein
VHALQAECEIAFGADQHLGATRQQQLRARHQEVVGQVVRTRHPGHAVEHAQPRGLRAVPGEERAAAQLDTGRWGGGVEHRILPKHWGASVRQTGRSHHMQRRVF